MAENSPPPDYYADLELTPDVTSDEIKAAFRRLAKKHHPDKKGPQHDGDTSGFRQVREAYEKLSNPETRRAYDQSRKPPSTSSEKSTQSCNVFTPGSPMYQRWFGTPSSTKPHATSGQAPGGGQSKTKPSTCPAFEEDSRPRSSFKPPNSPSRHTRSFSSPQPQPPPPPRPSFNVPQPRQYPRAHGMSVLIDDHPATNRKDCPHKAETWAKIPHMEQCIFCKVVRYDTSVCPGCQAMACRFCRSVIDQGGDGRESEERPKSFHYRPAGG